ncbi:hypothetical protein FD755_017184, partial [Muntiacus reevesi]
ITGSNSPHHLHPSLSEIIKGPLVKMLISWSASEITQSQTAEMGEKKDTKFISRDFFFLIVTPWTVARQAPLSMEFSRQEYCSGHRGGPIPVNKLSDVMSRSVIPHYILLPISALDLYKLYTFSECFCHAEQSSITGILGSVLPYYVATKLAKIRKPTLDKPSSETFVKSAIKTIGMQPRTNGYFIHSLMASVVSILPSWLYFKVAMNVNKSVRAHYLKKMKKN